MSQYVVLDQCLSLLRYVSEGDQVFHDDINRKVECLKALNSLFRYFRPDDPLVDELDNILSRIPYVKTGDIIMPDHHNLVVDALKKARDIISRMEDYYISLINRFLELIPWSGLGLGYGYGLPNLYFRPLISTTLLDIPLILSSPSTSLSLDLI
jgi:hypothetical protein